MVTKPLAHQETMALKNFVFKENWVVSEVAGMKITFFVIDTRSPKYGVTAYLTGYTGQICLRLNLYFQHIKKLLQSKKVT